MKTILYIGNKVSKHGKTATTIETLEPLLISEGFCVFSTSSQKMMIFRLFDMLFKILKHKNSIDYILIDTYSTLSFWYAFFCSQLARLFNIKYMPILHGGNLPNRLLKNPRLSKLIFKNAHLNIAPSNYLKTEFKKKGYLNTLLIPNVIEIENYSFLKRDFEVPKLLWVRSFDKIYNPKMAILAFSELKKTHPKAQLTMVGPDKDGSLEACVLLSKSLNVAVNFTGKLSKSDWIIRSKEHNIFLNTTHFDNTPISVLEAMALGLPIISTNVGGISYLLKDKVNAFLINDNNIKDLLKSVDFILNNCQIREQSIKNARALVEKYDWQNVKSLWINCLN